ncbi:MAG: NYN domain-containing protein [Candidatus Omnitrophota bacterium]
MKRLLIIDGYNVIRRNRIFEGFIKKSLQDSREHLIRITASFKERKALFDEAVIVFDGQGNSDTMKRHGSYGGVTLVFSSAARSADDTIRAIIQERCGDCSITVVSDDNYVANSARAQCSERLSTGGFMALARKGSVPDKGKTPCAGDQKCIDQKIQREINDELRRVWKIK